MDEYDGERDEELFWREAFPRHEPIQRVWFVPAVLTLVVVSVPWYWPAGADVVRWAGLPAWVWITIACSAGLSALVAYVALRHWDDDL